MRLARVMSLAILLSVAGPSLPSAAADVCGEVIPADRFVDRIPAYAQCDATTNSAIYSNNGIDTSTVNGGAGWVRTQGSGGYQCTEFAHRYLHFRWNVTSVPNGNAGLWCSGAVPMGLVKSTTPVHGDLIVFAPGSCGADATTGHVAIVDIVNADASVTAVSQNGARRGKSKFTCAACFLHVIANNGALPDAGVSPDVGAATEAPKPRDAGADGNVASIPMNTIPMNTGGAVPPTRMDAAVMALGAGGMVMLPMPTGGTGGTTGPRGSGGMAGTTDTRAVAPSEKAGAGSCAIVRGAGGGTGLGLFTLLSLVAAFRRRRR